MKFRLLVLSALFLMPSLRIGAQAREPSLSDSEIDKLREVADDPPTRILTFMGFLDDRMKAIDRLETGKRKPGREEDVHDQMEQFTAIAADLDDNLDDYAKRHKDVRNVLPKLIKATERWETALKSPPDDAGYKVSRVLALEALNDVRESARKLLDEQKAYFLLHPPAKPGGSHHPES